MGEAKRRGTRDERTAQSIQAARAKEIAEREEAQRWWASLTDEERELELERKRHRAESHSKVMRLFGIANALSSNVVK